MVGASKHKGAKALDDVRTQQQVGAGLEKKAASVKEQEAAQPERGDPAHDSPKRHGDKLEHARDEAAGRSKR
jgi:hypothetical protein